MSRFLDNNVLIFSLTKALGAQGRSWIFKFMLSTHRSTNHLHVYAYGMRTAFTYTRTTEWNINLHILWLKKHELLHFGHIYHMGQIHKLGREPSGHTEIFRMFYPRILFFPMVKCVIVLNSLLWWFKCILYLHSLVHNQTYIESYFI